MTLEPEAFDDRNMPGNMAYVGVNVLYCDTTYQRPLRGSKARRIGKDWQWRRCGVLIVEKRADGTLWVVEVQHRLEAARIAGLADVPCIIFPSLGIAHEAGDFLGANVDRKPLSSSERYIAAVVANEETAQIAKSVMDELGLYYNSHPRATNSIGCVGQLRDMAKDGREVLKRVLYVSHMAALVDNIPVDTNLLKALYWLNKNMQEPIDDPRFVGRLQQLGAKVLLRAGFVAVELSGKGGDRVRGIAVLQEVNKGRRKKFSLKGGE